MSENSLIMSNLHKTNAPGTLVLWITTLTMTLSHRINPLLLYFTLNNTKYNTDITQINPFPPKHEYKATHIRHWTASSSFLWTIICCWSYSSLRYSFLIHWFLHHLLHSPLCPFQSHYPVLIFYFNANIPYQILKTWLIRQ